MTMKIVNFHMLLITKIALKLILELREKLYFFKDFHKKVVMEFFYIYLIKLHGDVYMHELRIFKRLMYKKINVANNQKKLKKKIAFRKTTV